MLGTSKGSLFKVLLFHFQPPFIPREAKFKFSGPRGAWDVPIASVVRRQLSDSSHFKDNFSILLSGPTKFMFSGPGTYSYPQRVMETLFLNCFCQNMTGQCYSPSRSYSLYGFILRICYTVDLLHHCSVYSLFCSPHQSVLAWLQYIFVICTDLVFESCWI